MTSNTNISGPWFFHVRDDARKKYHIDRTLFSTDGHTLFQNFDQVKKLAAHINEIRAGEKPAREAVSAADLNAMGLMDEIMHFVTHEYMREKYPTLFEDWDHFLDDVLGESYKEALLHTFLRLFPSPPLFEKGMDAADYLSQNHMGRPMRYIVLEEMIIQWVQNQNPAYGSLRELIDDKPLRDIKAYSYFIEGFNNFSKHLPDVDDSREHLLDFLLLPSRKHPHSLSAQLQYMREQWGVDMEPFLGRLLLNLDYIKEEQKRFFAPGPGGPETRVPTFDEAIQHFEPEAFSEDTDWMPRLVLIAKSSYVWLDQLSRHYRREINRLDQIPDEELNRLANFGITGLWLIGLWERSNASQKIKQINGNPEAVASAYSLKNYEIAADLGGYAAYENLKTRAAARGIRLASDMVPNHTGLDSDWMIEHPEWFIQSAEPPFPSYRFEGPDLCDDDRVGIFLEKGYWDKSDAAVVFKRVDYHTGDVRYIYHGNDGTGMPWNDTAQLNYLLPEVRETVIQTILHVARLFPVIRFDAAMTLAKKHFQRLWFPRPGHGGDIPSRAQHAMSSEEFNKVFPTEFWREVVDRVAAEAPDTLLLAEAFWMMESYFVRSLGMHRVYNSAFMNMLKNEENGKYREMIRNVLEFNPQILRRYVNFMNNPDEETAVAQFGKGDKYFGVCTLMVTLPGLPMFGHGQLEGFHEKYGMEYQKAYWDEQADTELEKRHYRQITPLLKKRYLFADVENFYLYNFRVNGNIHEDVFCYSNRYNDERALVVYHNRYAEISGFIRDSVSFKSGEEMKQAPLYEGLLLEGDDENYVIFRELVSGRQYIRSLKELKEQGLFVSLAAYTLQVFMDFEIVQQSEAAPWARLAATLNGRGVESVHRALKEMQMAPAIQALGQAVTEIFTLEGTLFSKAESCRRLVKTLKETLEVLRPFHYRAVAESTLFQDTGKIVDYLREKENALKLNKTGRSLLRHLFAAKSTPFRGIVILTLFMEELSACAPAEECMATQQHFLLEHRLDPEQKAAAVFEMFSFLCCQKRLSADGKAFDPLSEWAAGQPGKNFLLLHNYDNVLYFNKERWEALADGWTFYSLLKSIDPGKLSLQRVARQVNALAKIWRKMYGEAEAAGYNWPVFIQRLTKPGP